MSLRPTPSTRTRRVPWTPLSDTSGLLALAERLAADLRTRWQRGEQPLAEEYLHAHPELLGRPEAAAELILEEVCLRQERGLPRPSSTVLRRFPQWSAQLRVLIDCHRALEADGAVPHFPDVGEALGDYRLVAELGRGAVGRVFLATQPELADRPVVLKLTPLAGGEHLALARLQHTHVVPLFAVHDDPGRRLRVLCLPYFGGATLAELLARLAPLPPARRRGRDLLRALDEAQARLPVTGPASGAVRDRLAGAGYVEAVCWLAACLADGLAYAHERGLLHLDLKPSNVLLAADGQPLLLDFHVARPPLRAGDPAPAWLGGTAAYLSPEQRAAMTAVGRGGPVPLTVDGRSDVYALGLVLYEVLSGALPDAPSSSTTGGEGRGGGDGTRRTHGSHTTSKSHPPTPALSRVEGGSRHVAARLRARNPRVSVGLADLVARCLAPAAQDRYPGAAALADDLRRHLTHQPLRGVANRDLGERWRKWRRRRPFALALLGLALVVAAAAGLAGWHVLNQLAKAREALREGQHQLGQRHYPAARGAFRRGLALAEDLPFGRDLARDLADGVKRAERGELADALHQAAEHARGLYGAEALAPDALRAAEALCGDFWERREQILALRHAGLPRAADQQVRADLLELAVLRADLRVRLAPAAERDGARRRALELLAEAERVLGPSPVLAQERRLHAAALGRVAAPGPDAAPAASAWEHYALGCSLLRAGDLAAAEAELDRALALEPQHLWANFYKGRCAYRRGRADDALLAFGVCVALAPDSAACAFNRGLAHEALGHADRARQDYDRALRLDPGLAPAALRRGLLHLAAGRQDAALADLRHALERGADQAETHYALALAQLARQDQAAARDHLRQALRHRPDHPQARALQESLRPNQ